MVVANFFLIFCTAVFLIIIFNCNFTNLLFLLNNVIIKITITQRFYMLITLHLHSNMFSGNCGSAFIEVLVRNSMWPQDKPFVTLLPSAMLMNPAECKHWIKTHTVRMFNQSTYCKGVQGVYVWWLHCQVICFKLSSLHDWLPPVCLILEAQEGFLR